MGLLKEFREFAIKGNVVDMAVGVIVGASFGKIVSSLVADIVTPPLGLLIGGVNFSHLALTLRQAYDKEPAVTLKYGVFVQAAFDFMIVASAIFMMVKLINRLRRQEEAKNTAPPEPPKQEQLLAEIRDLLKSRSLNDAP